MAYARYRRVYGKRTRKTTRPAYRSYKRYAASARKYRRRSKAPQKTSYLKGADYKKAQLYKSSVSHKLFSVKTRAWETEAPVRKIRVEEICPFKHEIPFWKKDGGAVIDQDLHPNVVYVRGGEWRVTLNNPSDAEAAVDMWLSFCKDGAAYETLEGTIDEAWHPHLSGSRFHDALNLSKYRRTFIIQPKMSKKFVFKLGNFQVKVSDWFGDKKGWPFLHVSFQAADFDLATKLKFTLTYQIEFTEGEDSRYAMSREEINKLTRSMEYFKEQLKSIVAGPADTTMDVSAQPSNRG